MRSKNYVNNFFNRDKKIMYMTLSILLVSIFTLTIVYAALSSTLNISGNAEITAASWNIYLDNVKVKSGSVSANTPEISGRSSVSFNVKLDEPGDFYQFTVDVVNDGSIDAMIDSVVKSPELTTEQTKYINYIIEYENGESISKKQTLYTGTTTPIKVKIEYRKDISPSDLPSNVDELNLNFTLVYVQSDETGSDILNNGVSLLKVVSGDINTIGSKVCIGTECFYVFDNDGTNVKMLAKYNLYVGSKITDESYTKTSLDEVTGNQDSSALGATWDTDGNDVYPWIGLVSFSDSNYWSENGLKSEYGDSYPAYVYDSNSNIYHYLENYKNYLKKSAVDISDIRLISYQELEKLGCIGYHYSCSSAPSWVYSTTYLSGSASNDNKIWTVLAFSIFDNGIYSYQIGAGIRPVIEIPISEF